MTTPLDNYLFNHVFLPTQVPARSDAQSGQGDRALAEVLLESINAFAAASDHEYYQHWSTIQRSLRTFLLLHGQNKSLSRDSLKSALRDAAHGSIIILHIALQNSALIIQKKKGEYILETFEASPRAADVLAAQGALEWDFPSHAVAIPLETFEEATFQDSLATFLEKASLEPVKQYAATTLKAGSNAYESRDTAVPAIIGQLLLTILEVPGRQLNQILTRKRVRDEVCWGDGAEIPWRRSATWLVLRVSIQRGICSLIGPHGLFHYKFLMCHLMASLCLKFCTQESFTTDRLAFARTKLARRVAKLETQRQSSTPEVSAVIQSLFSRNEGNLSRTLLTVQKELKDQGTILRKYHTKRMYRLPKRADNEATTLSLRYSRSTLDNILAEVHHDQSSRPVLLPQAQSGVAQYSSWIEKSPHDHLSTTDYYCLAHMDIEITNYVKDAYLAQRGTELDFILKLRRHLRQYQVQAKRAYKEDPEQHSLMLIRLMEIWIAIDSLAVRAYPLLVDYDPGFPLDIMYPLKAAKLLDIHRLKSIEDYLEGRRKQSTYRISNVLGDLTKACFAVRYFDRSEDMQDLYSTICKANDSAKASKERELINLSGIYESTRKQASRTACLFLQDEFDQFRRQHDDRRCRKCYLERAASRMSIEIHEDMLPSDEIHAKAVVFELLLPTGFGAWRDSVWQLLTLARGNVLASPQPKLMLREYAGLKQYAKFKESSITLASRTKSFYQTHYTKVFFPAQIEQVCMPHGLKYGLYDCEVSLWTSTYLDKDKPSFAALCSFDLPPNSVWSSVKRYLHPTFEGLDPSANEVVASQTKCPNSLTVAEYTSFQDLRIGTRIQWLKVLRELASPNMSFGSVENTALVTEVALGAGPAENGLLRCEISNSIDLGTAQKRSRESLHTALLCRKTFMLEAASVTDAGFEHASFACYLECAFTIKDNLSLAEPAYIAKMAPALRRLYVSDLQLVYNLESHTRTSVQTLQSAVSEAVNNVWMGAEGPSARKFSTWILLPSPQESWCTARALSNDGLLDQSVHFHTVEGTLYVDGQLLGRLPEEFSREDFFQQFFGNRTYLTRPSCLQGMAYMFVSPVEEHEVHFGFRKGYRFMRVRPRSTPTTTLEFLPATIFFSNNGPWAPDLPLPLIHNCIHWLDVQTGIVHVRPQATMWRAKHSDWQINLKTSQGSRRGKSFLVDPQSPLFDRVAQLIEPFETKRKMVIFQPLESNLTVQLPELELTFRVSFDGLLESRQLRAYVDLDQDAGTFYGLKSSLVLCDRVLQDHRSILVAIGPATVERRASHVSVVISHNGYYARFLVNTLLGRLECAPEPRLIYFKIYCHAITSSVHPDPLTAKTGTEEALACLQAANAQPWAPLDPEAYRILLLLADLTPPRVYYPENLKVLQRVHWDDKIMPAAQSGMFRPLVEDILEQCSVLHRFHLSSGAAPIYKRQSDPQLHSRALLRAQDFQPLEYHSSRLPRLDVHYIPRDSIRMTRCSDAYEAALLTWKWSSDIHVNFDLSTRMQEWPLIQGYTHLLETNLLSNLINLDPASNWGSLFRFCQQAQSQNDRARFTFLFGTMAFGGHIDMTLIRALIAVAILDASKDLHLPQGTEFIRYRRDQIPTVDFLAQYIKPHMIPYPADERALIAITMHSKQRRKLELRQRQHEEASEADCKALARYLVSQWPTRDVNPEGLPDLPLLDIQAALLSVKPEWERLSDNYQLSRHLADVQRLLDSCKDPACLVKQPKDVVDQEWYPCYQAVNIPPPLFELLYATPTQRPDMAIDTKQHLGSHQGQRPKKLHELIMQCSSVPSHSLIDSREENSKGMSNIPNPMSELEEIIRCFSKSQNPVRSAYGKDLKASLRALQKVYTDKSSNPSTNTLQINIPLLERAISATREEIHAKMEEIRAPMIVGQKWLEFGGLLPMLTPSTLLKMLRHGNQIKRIASVQVKILVCAELIVSLQQLLRIRDAHRHADMIRLNDEWHNNAHTGWEPGEHIDWLLLEIDFDFIIREDQLRVAQAMIASSSSISNFVLQMNMGQGKSSVIIPMVVTELANEKNLVRVVVPRSLLLQAAQLLSSRLGGLVDRRLKHVPFSRKSPTDHQSIRAYHKLHYDLNKSQGVLLTLPEHLLSFKLSGLQELANGRVSESLCMIKLQARFSRKARDVLDECDHMLAVKTQLIYPSGAQSPVDGHPNRWKLVQTVLKLAKAHFNHLRRESPKSLEVIDRAPGAFPTVYFLDQHVKDDFIQRLTDSILRGDGGLLPVQECSQNELAFAADFLRSAQFTKATASGVAQVFKKRKDIRLQLLLLRGLLVHRILLLGLSKRWNVQYGIHPLRDPIAVPFRSKGMPSDQAEFGHPDVSIILTCLSFYNTGLTLPQFQQSLGLLLKSDEPVREFESWFLHAPGFPPGLRSWISINVDDKTQCQALWGHLRLQMTVINFFLNHFVFPRHAKTFDRKLVSSGWDIATPLRSGRVAVAKDLCANKPLAKSNELPVRGVPTALTVGFSGTNDNKTLLPLNVVQNNLPGLSHTNAEVLTYLLQQRNRQYVPVCDPFGRRLSEISFLNMLKRYNIRMLLDAGAQILELDNISLAKAWLGIDTEAEAAVFFGEDERARVVYRDGKVQPLAVSPFFDNLGTCVVYLDEAHTRGVDLKMPPQAVAALTLGVMQTKDHTVQAAMRLRQLAISQSIIFFAPPEVHQSILNTRRENRKGVIDSYDVIIWLLEQTCCSIEQLQPLYVSQGLEYCRRRIAAQRYEDSGYSTSDIKAYLKILEQPEKYSLEELYAPDRKIKAAPIESNANAEITAYVRRLKMLKAEVRNTGDTVQALAHQEVEQEREVAIEVETVREVKKPQHAQACKQPSLHRDTRSFAETGRLSTGSHTCTQAFVALGHTAVGRRFGISDSAMQSKLYVTQDFTKTVVLDHSGLPREEYSRPVHWILWSMVTSTALIVSDYEANALIPALRDANPPVVHLICYAAPIAKSMVPIFDNLDFFSIPQLPCGWRAPAWLVCDLGIFAGRTYFDYDGQYGSVCEALGLPLPITGTMNLLGEMPFSIREDEFANTKAFSPSPLLFMQDWLAVRRKGQDFSQTMMGEICRGMRVDKVKAVEEVREEEEPVEHEEVDHEGLDLE